MLSEILTKMINGAAPRAPYAPGFGPSDETPPPPVLATDPRQRLREAQRALALTEAALDRSRDATARARAAVREAADAEENLRTAELAAESASREWAAAGAEGKLPQEAQHLLEAADRARTRAYQAQLKARGAELALSQNQFDSAGRGSILQSEREALAARDRAKEAVALAARGVLEAEIAAPALDRAEELRRQLDAELSRLLPLWQVLRYSRNVHSFAGGSQELHDELSRLGTHAETARQLPRDNTIGRSAEQRDAERVLAAFGEALMTNAEAQL